MATITLWLSLSSIIRHLFRRKLDLPMLAKMSNSSLWASHDENIVLEPPSWYWWQVQEGKISMRWSSPQELSAIVEPQALLPFSYINGIFSITKAHFFLPWFLFNTDNLLVYILFHHTLPPGSTCFLISVSFCAWFNSQNTYGCSNPSASNKLSTKKCLWNPNSNSWERWGKILILPN